MAHMGTYGAPTESRRRTAQESTTQTRTNTRTTRTEGTGDGDWLGYMRYIIFPKDADDNDADGTETVY